MSKNAVPSIAVPSSVSGPCNTNWQNVVRPSQIPSLSVSGSSGSVPVSLHRCRFLYQFRRCHQTITIIVQVLNSGVAVDGGFMVTGCHHRQYRYRRWVEWKASGPATQSGSTATGPSHIPSPSVSGLVGLVPSVASSISELPSLSSSNPLSNQVNQAGWVAPHQQLVGHSIAVTVLKNLKENHKLVKFRQYGSTKR